MRRTRLTQRHAQLIALGIAILGLIAGIVLGVKMPRIFQPPSSVLDQHIPPSTTTTTVTVKPAIVKTETVTVKVTAVPQVAATRVVSSVQPRMAAPTQLVRTTPARPIDITSSPAGPSTGAPAPSS